MGRICCAVAGGACAAALAAVPASAAQDEPRPVTAGALPTPQTNGIVFTVAIVGDTAYAGGSFSKARPAGAAPGSGEVDRHNLLAFRLSTGELLDWAPRAEGPVLGGAPTDPYCRPAGDGHVCDTVFRLAASPDGARLYAGGDFDGIDGQRRSRLAAFGTGDGALDPGFRPAIDGRVRAIAPAGDAVYLGGGISTVDGSPRTRLAAVGADGALRGWAPAADGEVFALLAAPQQHRVVLGGAFDHVGGQPRPSLTAVDDGGGAPVPWATGDPSEPPGQSVVTDIAGDGAGNAYVGAYNYGGGSRRFEGRASVAIADGAARWFDGCYGDTQALAVSRGVVYGASHTHDCTAIEALPGQTPWTYQHLTAETTGAVRGAPADANHVRRGDPIPELLPWLPDTDGGPQGSPWLNGPWAVAANGDYVVYGGEFSKVNGAPQQSLTRFAARGVPGAANNGPQRPFAAPAVTRGDRGTRIDWTSTWDAQNSDVTYQVLRDGTAEPLHTVTQRSRPWDLPRLSFTDPSPAGGTYWIRAVDADGAAISSPKATG